MFGASYFGQPYYGQSYAATSTLYLQNLTATYSASGVLTNRTVARTLTATYSASGILTKQTNRSLYGVGFVGTSGWYAGPHSTDVSGNTNWDWSA